MRIFLLASMVFLAACGYRSAAGRLAPDLREDIHFAPFRVRNDTPELALTHVVLDASRAQLGRMRILAEQGEDEEASINLELTIRRISEMPASYSPAGEIIEYYGEMYMAYRVYDLATTEPVLAVGTERLVYRYDFRPNPQDIRLYRYAAIGRAVREWVPQLTWQTAAAMRRREAMAAAVTEPTR